MANAFRDETATALEYYNLNIVSAARGGDKMWFFGAYFRQERGRTARLGVIGRHAVPNAAVQLHRKATDNLAE